MALSSKWATFLPPESKNALFATEETRLTTACGGLPCYFRFDLIEVQSRTADPPQAQHRPRERS